MSQLVRQFGQAYIEQYQPTYRVIKILHHIANCRTSALGGHLVKCGSCDYQKYVYNSCGRLELPSMSVP